MVPKKGTQASASLRREILLLNDGDVVAMCGSCQATHKHAVPQMTRVRGSRMSLTFRVFDEMMSRTHRHMRTHIHVERNTGTWDTV